MTARTFTLAASVALLAACGGGGSGVAPTPAAPQAPAVITVAAYGDSTQAAQGSPHAASTTRVQVRNAGVAGTTATQLLRGADGVHPAWAAQLARETAQAVVINHGINDRHGDKPVYRDSLRALVLAVRAAGKVPMLETPNPIDPVGFEDWREVMREVARAEGVYLCEQPRVPLSDGFHPTAEGYATKAQRLAQCLSDLLTSKETK